MGLSGGEFVFAKDRDSDLASSVPETDSPRPESRVTGFDCKRSALAIGDDASPGVWRLLWFAASDSTDWIFDLEEALVVSPAVVEVCLFDSVKFCFHSEIGRGSCGT